MPSKDTPGIKRGEGEIIEGSDKFWNNFCKI